MTRMDEQHPGAGDANLMTVIACSGDLDKLWPTMILATTAAASGIDVAIFYTFWGLFPLVREDVRLTGDDAMTKLLAAMNPPGFRRSKLSRLNMLGAGRAMMRKVARKKNVATPEELFAMAQELGVQMWPCAMTMELLGICADQMVDGLGEPVGAATALERMSHSKISLFI